jgi:hypothetical protein
MICFLGLNLWAFSLPEFKISLGVGFQGYDNFLAHKNKLPGNYFYKDTGGATEYETIEDTTFFGGHIFFDATYVEINVGISGSANSGNEDGIQFAIFGKYPFSTGNFTFFPLLGIQYDIVLAKKDGFGNKFGSEYYSWYFYNNGVMTSNKMELSDLNTLWFKLGIGGDILFSEKVFLRSEYMLGIAPLNNFYKNGKEEYFSSSDVEYYDYMINYSQTFRLSIGYRL